MTGRGVVLLLLASLPAVTLLVALWAAWTSEDDRWRVRDVDVAAFHFVLGVAVIGLAATVRLAWG